MNVSSLAQGGLSGPSVGPSMTSSGLAIAALPLSGQSAAAVASSSRDSAASGLLDLSSAINALGQMASAQGTDTSATLADSALQLPPLPPMPAPAKPPAIPTDDHGQSNVVFSDADDDATLIH